MFGAMLRKLLNLAQYPSHIRREKVRVALRDLRFHLFLTLVHAKTAMLFSSDASSVTSTLTILRGGIIWNVDLRDQTVSKHLAVLGAYDFFKLQNGVKILKKEHQKPERLINVGANLGSILVPALKDDLFSTAIAVEPQEEIYKHLKRTIAANLDPGSCEVFNLAVGSNTGHVEMRGSFGSARVTTEQGPGEIDKAADGRKLIPIEKLDSLVPKSSKRSLIFMDCEGYELEALQGAKELLRVYAPVIMELNPNNYSQEELSKLSEIVADYGFFASVVDPKIVIRAGSEFPAFLSDLIIANHGTDIIFFSRRPSSGPQQPLSPRR